MNSPVEVAVPIQSTSAFGVCEGACILRSKMHSTAGDYPAVFDALKPVLARYAKHLSIKVDTPSEYTVVSKSASPFHQHKGHPLHFGPVRLGKAYVSLHLMPLYMCPPLTAGISPALKKRMQGKTCFNFKTPPAPELINELEQLTEAGFKKCVEQKWL